MFDRDNYSDNQADDFVKVNEGVPAQIGQGQIDPKDTVSDKDAKDAQIKAYEEEKDERLEGYQHQGLGNIVPDYPKPVEEPKKKDSKTETKSKDTHVDIDSKSKTKGRK